MSRRSWVQSPVWSSFLSLTVDSQKSPSQHLIHRNQSGNRVEIWVHLSSLLSGSLADYLIEEKKEPDLEHHTFTVISKQSYPQCFQKNQYMIDILAEKIEVL